MDKPLGMQLQSYVGRAGGWTVALKAMALWQGPETAHDAGCIIEAMCNEIGNELDQAQQIIARLHPDPTEP